MTTKYRERSPTASLKPMSAILDLVSHQLKTNTLMLADQGIADDGCQNLTRDDMDGRLIKNADFRGNRITSAGLEKVVLFLQKGGNVEVLALNWNDLENDLEVGMMALENFLRSPGCTVRHLDLRNSNLSMNSADQICNILTSNSLRYIDLSWNNFNDNIVPKMVRCLNSRQYPIQIELKGAGLTQSGLEHINKAVRDLGVRFPAAVDVKLNSDAILTDVDGKKKLILDNLYHNERIRKLHEDSGRVVLNPDTAELEILMSEMMKKKIMAKDKLLREQDERLKLLHEVESEATELAQMRDRAANDNMALRRELENLKTTYSKTKQAFQIDQEGLSTQASALTSLINKRNVEARSAVDKLLHGERTRARDYSNQLELQENTLVDKIKTLSLDRDRLNKDLAVIREKIASFMQTFNSRLREAENTAKQEEKARAENVNTAIESRLLSITEGNQMAQRRANDELRTFCESEESLMRRMQELHSAIAEKKHLVGNLNDAIRTVEANNQRMVNEDISLDSKHTKMRDELYEVIDKIKTKKDLIEQHTVEMEDAHKREIVELGVARQSADDTISELEGNLRKIRLEMDRMDTRREHIVESVNRKVTDVIVEMARKYQ